MTIKDVIDKLSPEQRNEIFCAFNRNVTYNVPIGDGRVLAVHSENNPNLIVEMQAGSWIVGRFVNVSNLRASWN